MPCNSSNKVLIWQVFYFLVRFAVAMWLGFNFTKKKKYSHIFEAYTPWREGWDEKERERNKVCLKIGKWKKSILLTFMPP